MTEFATKAFYVRLGTLAISALLIAVAAWAHNAPRRMGSTVGIYGPTMAPENVPAEYDLVIVHYRMFAGDNSDSLHRISAFAAQGRRVIVDFQFMTSRNQRRVKAPLPPIEQVAAGLDAMLTQLEGVPLEGVTLDEENRTRPERIAYLTELYTRAKAAHPDRRLLQWLTLGAPQTRTSWDLERFPADGFVIDPYLIDNADYAAIVSWLAGRGLPLYSVVWASPGWQVGNGFRAVAAPRWWNGSQWRKLYGRLAINRHFDVATIFYAYALDRERVRPIEAGDLCDRAFAHGLLTQTVPRLRAGAIDLNTPGSRPDWLPGYCSAPDR